MLDFRDHTAHFFYLPDIHPFPDPSIAFKFLGIHLPFCQKSDLRNISPNKPLPVQRMWYNMNRVFHISMGSKLALYVLVAQQTHLSG